MSRGQPSRLIATLALTSVVAAWLAVPVSAVVRFEPAPAPAMRPPAPGERVEVTWAGIAITFPRPWEVRLKRPPDGAVEGGAAVLVALGPAGAICSLDLFDPRTVGQWEDVGIAAAARLSIAGVEAARYDDMWGGGSVGVSAYALFASQVQYSLLCKADMAPDDRWLSIASTIEIATSPSIWFRAPDA